MRGQTSLPLPVPRSGWMTSVPTQELPPDALADGQNIIVDQDGLLKPRLGYERLPFQIPVPMLDHGHDPRIAAMLSWQETGNTQLIVATLRRWWLLTGTGFVDITGDDQLFSSDPNIPVRLIQFGNATSTNPGSGAPIAGNAVYGVNGPGINLLTRWIVGQQFSEPVVDAAHNNFSVSAADMAIVGDRLVLINTEEGGTFYPQRVRWSSVLDGSSYPPLAFSDRLGTGDLIAIRVTSRTSAVIYAQEGAWIMTAQPGTDAGAFAFDRVQDVVTPPVNPNAIIGFGGAHVYVTQEKTFWRCDGQAAVEISMPINAGLLQLAVLPDQKPVGLYDVRNHRLIFFVTFQGETEAFHAIPYNLYLRAWEPPWKFQHAITAAANVVELLGPTWDNPGEDASGNTFTWDTAPWASWNAIPEDFVNAVYIGTADGTLFRFFSAASDDGHVIQFRALWGLRSAGDMVQRLQINQIEAQLQPIDTLEEPHFILKGLRTPYDSVQQLMIDYQLDQTNPPAWLVRLPPQHAGAGPFLPANYYEVTLQGRTVVQAPHYAGGALYAFVIQRPDIQQGATP